MEKSRNIFRLYCFAECSRDVRSGADLRTCLILSFLLSSHDMLTLVMRSKDERTRNAALLRYTCGHDGRYFGLFHLVVIGHHIVINSELVFCIVVYH